MNGETIDSWIHNLSTYFKTCPKIKEDMELYITNLQLEGIDKSLWDTQIENQTLVIDIGETTTTTPTCLTYCDEFFEELRECFYPLRYHYNLLYKWFQLR